MSGSQYPLGRDATTPRAQRIVEDGRITQGFYVLFTLNRAAFWPSLIGDGG
jgi:hypothetical protein